MTPGKNAVVAAFSSHTAAEAAVRELQQSGFDVRQLSIISRDFHPYGEVIGYFGGGGRVRYWGELGEFWDGMWGLMSGWGFFVIPGIGPLLVAGPLARWIVAALDNAAVFGALSALGAALYSIGMPKGSVLKYEAALRGDQYLVVAHGSSGEVELAREVLNSRAEQASRQGA